MMVLKVLGAMIVFVALGIGAFHIGVAIWGHGDLAYLTAVVIICGAIMALDPANQRPS